MEIQYFGANCVSISYKGTRIVIDDNLDTLGKKSVTKPEDTALFTLDSHKSSARLSFTGAGEYEVGDISIVGIDTKPFMNDDTNKKASMFKLSTSEVNVLVTGHVLGEFEGDELEKIGKVDVLVVPVGNQGYTLDPAGALKLIKDIEPKIVIPTHYDSSKLKYPVAQMTLANAIKELAMEPKDTVSKLKIKPADLSDVTQLVILEEN